MRHAVEPADIMQAQRVLAKQREVQELTAILAEVRFSPPLKAASLPSYTEPALCFTGQEQAGALRQGGGGQAG